MRKKDYPSSEYLRQCFEYKNGKLFWKVRPKNHFKNEHSWNSNSRRFAGKEAGFCSEERDGPRWTIRVNKITTRRHIIVWYIFNNDIIQNNIDVDHKNRNTIDDRIENLRLLCPNCHSQTDTFSGKSNIRKENWAKRKSVYKCEKCFGPRKCKHTKVCNVCSHKLRSKPIQNITEVLIHVNTFGFKSASRKYNMSDNGIRLKLKKAGLL